ncbi:MAG: permease-like cell division protein FtsX [Chitinophagaceae bacterium]
MAQSGKASIKRGKPSYFMAILGVTIVLFVLGIVGLLTINSRKMMQYFKESVKVQVFLQPNIKDTAREALQNYITAKPYVKNITYTDKEAAKKAWLQSGEEDFTEFLDNSLLPTSIDFTLKEEYVDSTKLAEIKADISQNPIVDVVKYPNAVVDQMQKNFRIASIIGIVIALVMAIAVIVLIDNTIRLAMFSNRFLIKTMQMVGATRWFIAKPLDTRAIVNGAISGIIAIAGLYAAILFSEKLVPYLKGLHDNRLLFLLFFVLMILGITISLFSTHRSVLKYLRLKLDELY